MSVAFLLLKLFQFKPGNPLVTPSKLQLQDLQTQLNDLHTKFKTWVTNVKKNKLKKELLCRRCGSSVEIVWSPALNQRHFQELRSLGSVTDFHTYIFL